MLWRSDSCRNGLLPSFLVMSNAQYLSFSTDGSRFFSLIKSLARTFGDNKKLNFVWIDPEPFPSVCFSFDPKVQPIFKSLNGRFLLSSR